jgi:hypothetical protein
MVDLDDQFVAAQLDARLLDGGLAATHQIELDDRFPGGHGLELDLTRGEGQVEPERP